MGLVESSQVATGRVNDAERTRFSLRERLFAFGPGRYSALFLWAIFIVLFGLLIPNLFLSVDTFQIVFQQGAVTAVLALAFLVPLTTDTFDLSIGEMMSFSIVLMLWLNLHTHLPLFVYAIAVVAVGACVGLVSGFIVIKMRVNSLIATLGMSEVLSAIQLRISNDGQVAGNFAPDFLKLGEGTIFGIPYLDIGTLIVAVIVWFVLEQTPTGRRMFAIGANPEAARLAGIKATRITWGALAASGAIAAFAGVMYTAEVGSYSGDVGQGYLFPALAAVFLGASQLSRRPNVWGTMIAFFALAFGIQGLDLEFGAGTFWVAPLFQGVALIVAVGLASKRGSIGRGRDGSALRRVIRSRRAES